MKLFKYIVACCCLIAIFYNSYQLILPDNIEGNIYYKLGKIYSDEKNNGDYAVRVNYIEKVFEDDDKLTIYIIKHDEGYIPLITHKNDEYIDEIYAKKNNLKETAYYIAVKSVPKYSTGYYGVEDNISVDLENTFIDMFIKILPELPDYEKSENSKFTYNRYLSKIRYDKVGVGNYIYMGIATIILYTTLKGNIIKKFKNKKTKKGELMNLEDLK